MNFIEIHLTLSMETLSASVLHFFFFFQCARSATEKIIQHYKLGYGNH